MGRKRGVAGAARQNLPYSVTHCGRLSIDAFTSIMTRMVWIRAKDG